MSRPSPAILIALAALFVALGGVAWAAIKLPKNSVGARQIAKNAVRSAEVKDRSLSAGDIKGGLPAGPPGRSALETLRSGETVHGTWSVTGDSGYAYTAVSLPIPAPVPIDDDHAAIKGNDDVSPLCTGTAGEPTAPPGKACVYLNGAANTTDGGAVGLGRFGNLSGANSRYGFRIGIDGPAPLASTFEAWGTWAYTAP